jgi:hypothetical protein
MRMRMHGRGQQPRRPPTCAHAHTQQHVCAGHEKPGPRHTCRGLVGCSCPPHTHTRLHRMYIRRAAAARTSCVCCRRATPAMMPRQKHAHTVNKTRAACTHVYAYTRTTTPACHLLLLPLQAELQSRSACTPPNKRPARHTHATHTRLLPPGCQTLCPPPTINTPRTHRVPPTAGGAPRCVSSAGWGPALAVNPDDRHTPAPQLRQQAGAVTAHALSHTVLAARAQNKPHTHANHGLGGKKESQSGRTGQGLKRTKRRVQFLSRASHTPQPAVLACSSHQTHHAQQPPTRSVVRLSGCCWRGGCSWPPRAPARALEAAAALAQSITRCLLAVAIAQPLRRCQLRYTPSK